jgi:glucose/mannose-6-phosphate isomerase
MKMEEIIRDLPDQIFDAFELASSLGIRVKEDGYGAVYVGGMGGSAVAGDILRDYTGGEMTVPYHVIRGYTFPTPPPGKLLLVASSYSGNTEEILSLFDQAEHHGADICAITTGGVLKERAAAGGYPTINVPTGYPPRGALGYSFISLLCLLKSLYPGIDVDGDVKRTVDLLTGLKRSYSTQDVDCLPLRLANEFKGKLPVIYASSHMESVALRWKGQLSENAKVLAYHGLLPEMNHNEVCGWQNNPEVLKELHAVFLRDSDEHPRVRIRMEITREMIEPFAGGVTEIKTTGKSLLERIFSLIYLGDFVSLYLSYLLETDPMPVSKIDQLKERLARISRK